MGEGRGGREGSLRKFSEQLNSATRIIWCSRLLLLTGITAICYSCHLHDIAVDSLLVIIKHRNGADALKWSCDYCTDCLLPAANHHTSVVN